MTENVNNSSKAYGDGFAYGDYIPYYPGPISLPINKKKLKAHIKLGKENATIEFTKSKIKIIMEKIRNCARKISRIRIFSKVEK